jgi:four helix bundle protein
MAADFKDLDAFKESIILGAMITPVLRHIRGPGAADLIDQLARAADSVPANIAEGYAKGFCPDYVRYLKIALGSAGEIEARLEGAIATQRISEELARPVIVQARKVRALIRGFIRYVERRIAEQEPARKPPRRKAT